jgi:hypothetical protein
MGWLLSIFKSWGEGLIRGLFGEWKQQKLEHEAEDGRAAKGMLESVKRTEEEQKAIDEAAKAETDTDLEDVNDTINKFNER